MNSNAADDEIAEIAECEARGFPLEQLPGTSPAELLDEVWRLEACSVEELRDECAQQWFPAAGQRTRWGEHEELARVLMDLYIWKRLDVANLRELCRARGLAVTATERTPELLNHLRVAAWAEQGIPLRVRGETSKAQALLRRLRALERKSLEELRSECKEREVAFDRSARQEELVSLLRLQEIWRESVPMLPLEQSCFGGRDIPAAVLADRERKEGIIRCMEWCRGEVSAAFRLASQLRLPVPARHREEGRLFQIIKDLKSRPVCGFSRSWLSQHLCRSLWECCGVPVHQLSADAAAAVAGSLQRQQQASHGDLQQEYSGRYGLPEERRLDTRTLRRRLRWLVLEEAEGRMTWVDRGKARGIAIDRLQGGHLPILRLARRLDALAGMAEERVRQECKARRLLWTARAEHRELKERLCREACLLELSWDELHQECVSSGVPLESRPCWSSPEQESVLRRQLVRWCLVYENRQLWETRGLPLLRPDEATSLLEWCGELEEMSDQELVGLCATQGLPDDTALQRQGLLEHLKQRLVWELLPLDELKSTCLQKGAPARVVSQGREELVLWLLTDRVYCAKGIPVKHLQSPNDAKQLHHYFCEVEAMDQQTLVERCGAEGLPVVGLPPREELLERLKKVRRWHLLADEALLDECRAMGALLDLPTSSPPSRSTLLRKLMLHEYRQDLQQIGITTDDLQSVADCAQLAKEWEEIEGLTEGELHGEVMQSLGNHLSSSRNIVVELLREVKRLQKVPLDKLQRICRKCRDNHSGLKRLNTIAQKGQEHALVRKLTLALWQGADLTHENVPAGQPSKLELLSLLAKFRRKGQESKVDFRKAMDAWSWWDLRLFLQSEGAFDPDDPRLAAMRRKPPAPRSAPGVCPLVSVVTPTWEGRQHFHEQLWHCFEEQTWEEKELVVVETWTRRPSPVFAAKQHDPRLVYVGVQVQAEGMPTLGSKRNLCNQLASGAFIANFDDDDLYAPKYLETMLQHLCVPKQRDLVKLSGWYVFNAGTSKFGYFDAERCSEWLYGYGFSYVYTKESACRAAYCDTNYKESAASEDYPFSNSIWKHNEDGIALIPDNFGLCLHCEHGSNCANSAAHYQVSPHQAKLLEVCTLPRFEDFLGVGPRPSVETSDDDPLPYLARRQKLQVKSVHCIWNIEVVTGLTAREVVQRLRAADRERVLGEGNVRLSLGEEKPPVLMLDDETVPLRATTLYASCQVIRTSTRRREAAGAVEP